MPLPQLLSERELNAQTGIPVKTLQKWRWQGWGPPYIKTGPKGSRTKVRYVLPDVQAWLDAHTVYAYEKENPLDQ